MATRQLAAFVVSFLTTSLLGSSFVFSYWSSQGAAATAASRVIVFVALMAVVHFLGAYSYVHQTALGFAGHKNDSASPDAAAIRTSIDLSQSFSSLVPSLRAAIWVGLLQHLSFLVLTALILDGGRAFRVCYATVLGHWIAIALVLVRRGASPTKRDLLLVKYGFGPLIIVAGILLGFVQP